MIRVCFVCLGNICRSPMAEGIFRSLVDEAGLSGRIHVESAGTADYHVGERPDPRSRKAAAARGVRLDGAARQFDTEDFARFDLVVAMDRANARSLRSLAGKSPSREKVVLLRSFDPTADDSGDLDVPDPYYGGRHGFDRVFEICEAACRQLLEELRARKEALG